VIWDYIAFEPGNVV